MFSSLDHGTFQNGNVEKNEKHLNAMNPSLERSVLCGKFYFLTLRLQIPNILNNSVGICIMYKHQNIRNYVTTIQDTNFNQMKEMQDKIFAQRESTMFT